MTNAITNLTGRGIPLRGNDIDTDQIIPSRYLKTITFEGLEHHAFEDTRKQARSRGENHPLDDQRYAGGSILLVNGNFGCGSSREHAPQALCRSGVRAIVGESFGEIFAGNCLAVGIACVSVLEEVAQHLQSRCEAAPSNLIRIDLMAMTLEMTPDIFDVEMRAGPRQQLLEGSWDSMSVLLAAADRIRNKIGMLGV